MWQAFCNILARLCFCRCATKQSDDDDDNDSLTRSLQSLLSDGLEELLPTGEMARPLVLYFPYDRRMHRFNSRARVVLRENGPYGLFWSDFGHGDGKHRHYTRVIPFPPVELIFPPPDIRSPYPPKKFYPPVFDGEEELSVVKSDVVTISLEKPEEQQLEESTPIPQLIHDIYYMILPQLPLRTQISLRSVCRQFADIIEGHLGAKQISLILFSQTIDLVGYCKLLTSDVLEAVPHLRLKELPNDDDLIVRLACPGSGRAFGEIFSNLQTLVVYFGEQSQFNHLPEMLRQLPRLQILSLLGEIKDPLTYEPTFPDALADAIESALPRLNQLDLQVRKLFSYIIPGNRSDSIRRPLFLDRVLHQLQTFTILGYITNLFNILANLGPDCRECKLKQTQLTVGILEQAVIVNGEFCRAVRKFGLTPVKKDLVSFLSRHFVSIEILELQSSRLFLSEYVNDLLRFPALTELILSGFMGLHEAEAPPGADVPPLMLPANQILPGITRLTLKSFHSFRNHQLITICQRISVTFPRLRVLNLGIWEVVTAEAIRTILATFFEHLVELRVFYMTKVQADLLSSHLKEKYFIEGRLARAFHFRRQANTWQMIEEGVFPDETPRSNWYVELE